MAVVVSDHVVGFTFHFDSIKTKYAIITCCKAANGFTFHFDSIKTPNASMPHCIMKIYISL